MVEGKTDKQFVEALISKLSVDNVQILLTEGKDNYPRILQTVVLTSGFKSIVRRLGLIRDNDDDPEAAFKSIRSGLEENGLPCPKHPEAFTGGEPPIVGVFLMPGRGKKDASRICALQPDRITRLWRAWTNLWSAFGIA